MECNFDIQKLRKVFAVLSPQPHSNLTFMECFIKLKLLLLPFCSRYAHASFVGKQRWKWLLLEYGVCPCELLRGTQIVSTEISRHRLMRKLTLSAR